MINIPADVEKYLVKDEIVDKEFDFKDRNVFATANRLIIKHGNTVKDISFAHISSMESRVKRNWLIIIIGIVIILGAFYLRQLDPPSWASAYPWSRLLYGAYGDDSDWGGWVYYISGVIAIIVGSRLKIRSVKLSVAGLSEAQVFVGGEYTVDAFFRLVNERRLQIKTNQAQVTNNHDIM